MEASPMFEADDKKGVGSPIQSWGPGGRALGPLRHGQGSVLLIRLTLRTGETH